MKCAFDSMSSLYLSSQKRYRLQAHGRCNFLINISMLFSPARSGPGRRARRVGWHGENWARAQQEEAGAAGVPRRSRQEETCRAAETNGF